jgi:predicted translin family RNA/ssDNA-binding protein
VAFDITLERRIRELCAQAVAARDTDDLQPTLTELRQALREHVEQIKTMLADYPFLPVNVDNVAQLSNRRADAGTQPRKKAV